MAALLIFLLALLLFMTILLPEISKLLKDAIVSQDVVVGALALGSLLLAAIVFLVPLYLIVQGYRYFQNAQELDRTGTQTTGWVLDKWVDESDNEPFYQVRYSYLLDQKAVQSVTREFFHRIKHNEKIFVLYLDHAPHISRLVLDEAEQTLPETATR